MLISGDNDVRLHPPPVALLCVSAWSASNITNDFKGLVQSQRAHAVTSREACPAAHYDSCGMYTGLLNISREEVIALIPVMIQLRARF
jgi:hypothetical protein